MAVDVYSTVLRAGYPIEVLSDYNQAMNRYAFLLDRLDRPGRATDAAARSSAMWWDDKIHADFPLPAAADAGQPGPLPLGASARPGGDIGEIRIVHQGAGHVERDIVVFADDRRPIWSG